MKATFWRPSNFFSAKQFSRSFGNFCFYSFSICVKKQYRNNYEIDSSLKNFVRVNEFLELVVVKLLRFALYNQVLVEGLKEC